MFKNLLSIIGGLFSAFLLLLLVEKTLPLVFNVIPIDATKDAIDFNEYIKNLPIQMLAVHAIAYGIVAFAGSYVTFLLCANPRMSLIMTTLFLVVVLVNYLMFHHPQWIIILGSSATVLGGFLGTKIHSKTT